MQSGEEALITGANGFTGSFLAAELLRRGIKVRCLVRSTANLRWLKGLDVSIVNGEITRKESLKGKLSGINYVFHCAGAKQGRDWNDFAKVNILGTENLVETALAEALGLKKFVYISSMAAMGPSCGSEPSSEAAVCNPLTFYGTSKLKGEEEVLKRKNLLPVVILRPPAIYGPRDEDMLAMFKAVKFRVKPFFGLKEKYLNLCYIDDLIQGCVLAAQVPVKSGSIYMVADENIHSWEDVYREMSLALNIKALKLKIPVGLILTSALISELVAKGSGKSTMFTRQKVREMSGNWACDIRKAKAELGFKPKFGIKKGIALTAKWYVENGWL